MFCKRCFKVAVDKLASDKHLLLSKDNMKCDYCKQELPLVVYYFKYGEHEVTEDGKRVVNAPAPQKVNPNYSFWGTEPLYVD